jgi:hypothetical protein
MTTNPDTGRRQSTLFTLLAAFALATGATLLLGCSEDALVSPNVPHDLAASAPSANAGLVVQSFPSEEDCPVCAGPPIVASGLTLGQTGFGATRTDGEWVAITFMRDVVAGCVPDDYDLLTGPHPSAFACPLTVEGKAWLRDRSDPMPVRSQHRGLGAVPIYFVGLPQFESAVEDGKLTVGELNGLSPLHIGHASYHRDVIQFPGQGSRPGEHSIVSRGHLQDGRAFQFSGVVRGTENVNTRIEFE